MGNSELDEVEGHRQVSEWPGTPFRGVSELVKNMVQWPSNFVDNFAGCQ